MDDEDPLESAPPRRRPRRALRIGGWLVAAWALISVVVTVGQRVSDKNRIDLTTRNPPLGPSESPSVGCDPERFKERYGEGAAADLEAAEAVVAYSETGKWSRPPRQMIRRLGEALDGLEDDPLVSFEISSEARERYGRLVLMLTLDGKALEAMRAGHWETGRKAFNRAAKLRDEALDQDLLFQIC